MSPLDRDIVRRKLEIIVDRLTTLEAIGRLGAADYLVQDVWHRKGTERMLHELIEAAIDINAHLLVQGGHATPDTMYESFLLLGDAGIISVDLAQALAPSAGLRNRLVHEYERIDQPLVHQAVQVALRDYPRYVAEVERWLHRDPP
jgi:uncharacterized protein YutE (UPF0331/DUF86 family)